MTDLAEIETPAVLVDVDRLEGNVASMAGLCAEAGVALRPHVKTHKCPEIARMQISHGAVGLTAAKLGEAEVFVDAGFEDVFVCYPIVGPAKLERLRTLGERARISTIVDSPESVERLASAFEGEAKPLEVMIKLDVGLHRVGVDPAACPELVERIAAHRSLSFKGICIHEGGTYAVPDPARRRALARAQVERMVGTAELLRERGFEVPCVSAGATPAARSVFDVPGLTELRPGNYVFYDETQVGLGVAEEHSCALSVLTTVVGAYPDGRGVIDAGAKTLSLDQGAHGLAVVEGFGRLVDRPGLRLVSLSEEHGWLRATGGEHVRAGERLQVVPNHACMTVNNFDRLVTVRDGCPEGSWSVAARGCLT